MNVDKVIEELNAEIERLKAAIVCLEPLRGSSVATAPARRRGRKSMNAKERQEVSARITADPRHLAIYRATSGTKLKSMMPSLYSTIPAKLMVSNRSVVKPNHLPQNRYSHACGNAHSRNQINSTA